MVPSDENPPLSASGSRDEPEGEEVYGPLRFRRHVKGDGRALILYTHAEPGQAEGPGGRTGPPGEQAGPEHE